MCFEILGFDIILDQTFKPYLLEVNHAPSFNTDTPLDYYLKRKLLKDTLTLLGISIDDKKQKLLTLHEEKQHRMTHKSASLKQKQESQYQ